MEWNKMTSKTPPFGKDVLLCGDSGQMFIGSSFGEQPWGPNVTHWAPLPDLPEGVSMPAWKVAIEKMVALLEAEIIRPQQK